MHNKDLITYSGELIHSHIEEKCKLLGQIRNLNIENVDLIQSMNAQALIEQVLRKKYDRQLEKTRQALNDKYEAESKIDKIISIIANNSDINIIRNRTLKVMVGVK